MYVCVCARLMAIYSNESEHSLVNGETLRWITRSRTCAPAMENDYTRFRTTFFSTLYFLHILCVSFLFYVNAFSYESNSRERQAVAQFDAQIE